MYPKKVRNYIHNASPKWMAEYELSKDNMNRQANVDKEFYDKGLTVIKE